MTRHICIHGHFYQPPRENPWLEEIEVQDSAHPYHDWNERISEECYGPNATARIMTADGKIERIVNNYARISFNFGPTLLSWMEKAQPELYQAILEADRESQRRFSGHGSAIAQVYNHMILPLATRRDRHTQVFWGIRDFEHRFNRAPEGMWLSETAVDMETLEILADQGIKYVILSPYQAKRFRSIGARNWRQASEGRIDPRRPYLQNLPSGASIAVFYYDGPVSQAIAFEGLLVRGEYLAERLLGAFEDDRDEPQLVHVATDGETYGHHHRHGDMALAYALQYIDKKEDVELTNYAEYLEKYPPQWETQIEECTSWSCAHGVERWRSDCGCHTGGHGDWNQAWRKPLRDALDWLRDELTPRYAEEASKLFDDPWRARDDYIEVILDRSPDNFDRFLSRHAIRQFDASERVRAAKLFELQRHLMLMYTSCGWFFDELSGIETVQVIAYAGRALQLAKELFGNHTEEEFLSRLEKAKSNLPDHQDGRRIYDKFVRPAFVDLNRVGAHYVITSLFQPAKKRSKRIHCYRVTDEEHQEFETGRNRMVIGRATFHSDITMESAVRVFGAVYFGHHTVNAGIREFRSEEAYQSLVEEAQTTFEMADYPKIIRAFDRHFGDTSYSLFSLFRDQQQKVLDQILSSTVEDVETQYAHIYEDQAPLLRFLHELNARVPEPLRLTAELVLNARLQQLLSDDELDRERILNTIEEAEYHGVTLHAGDVQRGVQRILLARSRTFLTDPGEIGSLEALSDAVQVTHALPFGIDVRKAQNAVYRTIDTVYREMQSREQAGETHAKEWAEKFRTLADSLNLIVG